MERPQDLRRTLTEGAAWTTWLLQTKQSLKAVTDEDYLNNVYRKLLPDDELIIRIRNSEENYRLHLLIREIDLENAKVYTVVIHKVDLTTGEDVIMIEESENDGRGQD